MKKILILSSYYSPAYKGGGPIKSISGLANKLKLENEIFIFCLNQDIDGELLAIPCSDKWLDIDGINVFYSSKDNFFKNLRNIFRDNFDYLYLNSFFSSRFSIIPLILVKFFGNINNIVLAPRGELSPGALRIRSKKKEKYLFLANLCSLYSKNIVWHATSDLEANEISLTLKKHLNLNDARIKIAQNISPISDKYRIKVVEKKQIDLVFFSRISPKKNLKYALKVLSKSKLDIIFDIWGPIEDREYWSECEKLIELLPDNIIVKYCGSISPHEVPKMLSNYDLFFFPTLGENYGHVIAESLSVGTPLLISDTTPWINLQKYGVGKEIDLKNMMGFVEFLEDFNRKTIQEKSLMRQKALEYFSNKFCGENIVNATYSLFKSDV